MNINIKATGIELTPAVSEYVTRKVSMLDKFAPEGTHAQAEVGKTTQHHRSGNFFRAEIHLVGAGVNEYAVSEQADLYAAIDVVKDELARKLAQRKGKRLALARRGAQRVKDALKGLNPFRK